MKLACLLVLLSRSRPRWVLGKKKKKNRATETKALSVHQVPETAAQGTGKSPPPAGNWRLFALGWGYSLSQRGCKASVRFVPIIARNYLT
jgi:hypothetical protein